MAHVIHKTAIGGGRHSFDLPEQLTDKEENALSCHGFCSDCDIISPESLSFATLDRES